MLRDKILLWKLKRGNKDALRVIYEKYKDDLLRIAAALLTLPCHAEDVVHDVFANFITASADFTLTGSLKGYLATCVANKARNINRSAARHQTASIDQLEPTVADTKRPEQWIIYDEQLKLICSAMAQLPYEQREAVTLRIQCQMKFKEIAALQQTSTKTALSRYRYGINKLRSILNNEAKK